MYEQIEERTVRLELRLTGVLVSAGAGTRRGVRGSGAACASSPPPAPGCAQLGCARCTGRAATLATAREERRVAVRSAWENEEEANEAMVLVGEQVGIQNFYSRAFSTTKPSHVAIGRGLACRLFPTNHDERNSPIVVA